MNQHFVEKCQIVPAFLPVALGAGANNGDWVSMRDYNRCAIVFVSGTGGAGEDPTITVLQAQSNGGSSKALNFSRVDYKQASTLTAVGQFTTETPAAGNTYTNATMGETAQVVVIDIKAEDLDIENGYDWLQANIADTGSISKIAALMYILHEPKYAAGGVLPSAIA